MFSTSGSLYLPTSKFRTSSQVYEEADFEVIDEDDEEEETGSFLKNIIHGP